MSIPLGFGEYNEISKTRWDEYSVSLLLQKLQYQGMEGQQIMPDRCTFITAGGLQTIAGHSARIGSFDFAPKRGCFGAAW